MRTTAKTIFLLLLVLGVAATGFATGQGEPAQEVKPYPLTFLMTGDVAARPLKPDDRIVAEINRRLGIELNVKAVPGDAWDKIAVTIASGDLPDLTNLTYPSVQASQWVKDGILVPLNDYLPSMPTEKKRIERTITHLQQRLAEVESRLEALVPEPACQEMREHERRGTADAGVARHEGRHPGRLALAEEREADPQVRLARGLVIRGGEPQERLEPPGVGAFLLHVHAGPDALGPQALEVVEARDPRADPDEVGDPVEAAALRREDHGTARTRPRGSSARTRSRRPRSTSSPCP